MQYSTLIRHVSRYPAPLFVASLLILIAGCGVATSGSSPEPSSTNSPTTGVLAGQVLARSSCGAQNSVTPCALAPLPGAVLSVKTAAGTVVASITCDQQGHFSIILPPGSYLVQPESKAGSTAIKGPAVAANVVSGQTVSIQVIASTGLPRS